MAAGLLVLSTAVLGTLLPLLLTYRQSSAVQAIMTVTLDVGVQTLIEFEHQAFLTPSPFSCSCLSHSDNEKGTKLINL